MALALAVSLAACAKFQTARECGVFVDAMNEWKTAGAQAAASVPATSTPVAARQARELAERYEKIRSKIEGLGLSSPALVAPVRRYQALSREAAQALRDVARTAESGDAEAARRRRVAFDDIARGESAIVAEINVVCR